MAYSNRFCSMFNDNFKILTWVLILFISITPNFLFINAANAFAAEKWDYEVSPIPDQNQRVVVTGHKVNQYGDAVNDSKYKTTIDPKTLPNKQKMGGVAIAKLLKKANWASAGVEAFQALLEGIDWVIDAESQSIWRYKQSGPSFACKNFGYKWRGSNGNVGACPADVAQQAIKPRCVGLISNCKLEGLYTDDTYSTKIEHIPNNSDVSRIWARYTYNYSGNAAPDYLGEELQRDEKINTQPSEKEYLTPETAADYANKTHPDYNNPAYKPKLDEKYKPEIVPNLWKPHNEWEKTNSPTVQEVVRQLEQSNPTSNDKDIEQKTDEQGNPTGGFSLPEFCSWATPVCDFIKWVKEQPENEENTQIEVENLDETLIFDDSQRFTFADSCPSPEQFSVSFFGTTQNLEFSYQPLCDFMSMIKPFVVAGSYLIGAYIVMGLSRGSGE